MEIDRSSVVIFGLLAAIYGFIGLLIIFWIWKIVKNRYAATRENFSKHWLFIFGYGLLIVFLTCLVTIPIIFIITLGVGMSGDFSPFVTNLWIIGLFLSPIIAFITGLAGLIMVNVWKKNNGKPD